MNCILVPSVRDTLASNSTHAGLGLELCLGALVDLGVGILTTIGTLWFVESKRKAKLQISRACPEADVNGAAYVGVYVSNPPMCKPLARIFDRDSAMSCRVSLKFRDVDGCPVTHPANFPINWIEGRWDQAQEPQYHIYEDEDPIRFQFSYIDYETDIVSNSTPRTVKVAVQSAIGNYYVWNDKVLARLRKETDKQPELDRLRLEPGGYRVTVKVTALGRVCSQDFLLEIPQNKNGNFRLSDFQGTPPKNS